MNLRKQRMKENRTCKRKAIVAVRQQGLEDEPAAIQSLRGQLKQVEASVAECERIRREVRIPSILWDNHQRWKKLITKRNGLRHQIKLKGK